ncbi:hypothetical protein WMF20_03545 [Sorangium sp. So ce834]|uniref:hypothetical protein n=1 Tax=Sorangium sp. So ce834 TaxID=3133321 RepID=UPI003F64180D
MREPPPRALATNLASGGLAAVICIPYAVACDARARRGFLSVQLHAKDRPAA